MSFKMNETKVILARRDKHERGKGGLRFARSLVVKGIDAALETLDRKFEFALFAPRITQVVAFAHDLSTTTWQPKRLEPLIGLSASSQKLRSRIVILSS